MLNNPAKILHCGKCVADLHGKTIRQRVQALVNIAAPEFREELLRFAREPHWI